MLADREIPNLLPSPTYPRRFQQDVDSVFEDVPASTPPPLSPRAGPAPGIVLTVEGDEPPQVINFSDSNRQSRQSRRHHHQHQSPRTDGARSPSATRMRRNASNHKLREPGMANGSSGVSRSQSMRTARRPQSVDPSYRFRQRIASIPNDMTLPSDYLDPNRIASNQSLPLPGDEAEVLRLRNFAVTPKGVVNRGDSFRSKSRSTHSVSSAGSGHIPVQRLCSDESATSERAYAEPIATIATTPNAEERTGNGVVSEAEMATASASNVVEVELKMARYRVLVIGSPDVGKTALTRQFMTSEYICAYDSSIDEDNEKSVTVVLNGEESELVFLEHTFLGDTNTNFASLFNPDAYLVVYSVTSKRSLQVCKDIIRLIQKWDNVDTKPVILVGNKTDLARLRVLNTDDGRSLAMEEGSKFIETSAGINHHVDELLVGILTQIRLKLSSVEKIQRKRESVSLNTSDKLRGGKCAGCAGCRAKGLIKRILKKACSRSKSCDNLHIL